MGTEVGTSYVNRSMGPTVAERTREKGPQIEDAGGRQTGVRSTGEATLGARAGVGDQNNGASVGAQVGGKYTASAGVTSDGHLKAGVTATAGASVDATAQGRLGNDEFNASGRVQAVGGANAAGSASAQVGVDGVKVGASGRAFAGAEVNGAANAHVGPLDAGVGGGLSVGIGAQGSASASLSADKIGFQLKGGLTLGVGFNVNMNVSVNPTEVVNGAKDLGSQAVHALGDAGSAVKHFFGL